MEWALQLYLPGCLSLSPYLYVCTLCAKIQSIATPAVERGEGQQPHWRSRARQTDGDTEHIGNTLHARHISSLMLISDCCDFFPFPRTRYDVKHSFCCSLSGTELKSCTKLSTRIQFGLETFFI